MMEAMQPKIIVLISLGPHVEYEWVLSRAVLYAFDASAAEAVYVEEKSLCTSIVIAEAN